MIEWLTKIFKINIRLFGNKTMLLGELIIIFPKYPLENEKTSYCCLIVYNYIYSI